MAAALGEAATLLGKVFTMLSAAPVAAYVDSLQLGHNSQQIRAKLAHTRGLLHNAQEQVRHNPGLQDLLPALSRNADQAEDLLDELHYFQIHDRLHGTTYATTQANFLRHGRNALRHTATSSWAACFSCSSAQDDDDALRFHPVIFSRKIKSVLQDMQTQWDSVSDLLGNIPSNSMAVALHWPQIGSTIIQDTLYGMGLSWSTLPPFAKLPNLKGLKLMNISGMHQFGLRCGGAPGKCSMRLKTIEFCEMPELAKWAAEPNCHSFPSIEEIICIHCPNLCVMPFSEASCTNLRRLRVFGCPKMSLPSMPHTSTLTSLDVGRGDSETLSYDGKKLVVSGYGGALASHNMDKVEDMTVGRCDGLFLEELDASFVLRSVKSLKLDVSHLTRKSSSSKVLNCFPALSVLVIDGYESHDYEECVMQFPSSSSLQELTFSDCKGLVLVPVEEENGGGIQEDNSLLQSLTIYECGKLFSQWPMGKGESEAICPFPASLRQLDVYEEPSMKSMALLKFGECRRNSGGHVIAPIINHIRMWSIVLSVAHGHGRIRDHLPFPCFPEDT